MSFEKGSITLVDNMFTNDECVEMIEYFKNNNHDYHHTTDYRNHTYLSMVSNFTQLPRDDYSKKIALRLFNYMGGRYRIQRTQLEERHDKSSLKFHLDSAFGYTAFTSVTYLNEEFDGGLTIIRPPGEESDKYNLTIQPRVGRTLFFHGSEHQHCITEVANGNRYTLATWYMAMPLDLPEKHKWWLEG